MTTYPFTRSNVDDTVNRVYEYIVDYIRDKGYPPAVRDICAGVGIRSTSTIHSHLQRLQQQGKIVYSSGKRRAITIPEQESNRVVSLPLVGEVTAGMPIFAQENIERFFPFPADFLPDDRDIFILKVKGDSMVGAAILDGDYVIVRKQSNARTGDIIVALVGDEATVKKLANVDGQIVLQPQNPAYPLIPFDKPDCQILGKVCGLYRDHG